MIGLLLWVVPWVSISNANWWLEDVSGWQIGVLESFPARHSLGRSTSRLEWQVDIRVCQCADYRNVPSQRLRRNETTPRPGACRQFFLLLLLATWALSLTVSEIWPSFPLKNAHFLLPLSFNHQLEKILFGIDGWNFACPSLRPMANYSCKNFSHTPYPLATIYPLQTERQTDARTTTHANSSTFTTVRSANKRSVNFEARSSLSLNT